MMSDVTVEVVVIAVVHASVAIVIVQDRPVRSFEGVQVNDCQLWSYFCRVLRVKVGHLLMIDGCYRVAWSCSQD
jgi:hypothetical protein